MTDEKPIATIISQEFPFYIDTLKKLVSVNTVYNNQKGIEEALSFCEDWFKKYLPISHISRDKNGNIICLPKQIKTDRPVLYFSAHIDTVPAIKEEWESQYDPFIPYEDEQILVGRGVNDCKAGVAYQLFIAYLASKKYFSLNNVIFTISSHEEQAGMSSQSIGEALGNSLPVGEKTYLITLENNVTISEPPVLAINYGERSAFGIEIIASWKTIHTFLSDDPNPWNPTICEPIESKVYDWKQITQRGGHAASVLREKNELFVKFMGNKPFVMDSHSKGSLSTVPDNISYAPADEFVVHRVVFDLRTTRPMLDIIKELDAHNIPYKFLKQLDNGYDIHEKLFSDEIHDVMEHAKTDNLNISFEINPGTTDSGTMNRFCNPSLHKTFFPITMGPGSRSQKNSVPPRMTHGRNETFVRGAGKSAVEYITNVIHGMKFLI